MRVRTRSPRLQTAARRVAAHPLDHMIAAFNARRPFSDRTFRITYHEENYSLWPSHYRRFLSVVQPEQVLPAEGHFLVTIEESIAPEAA